MGNQSHLIQNHNKKRKYISLPTSDNISLDVLITANFTEAAATKNANANTSTATATADANIAADD